MLESEIIKIMLQSAGVGAAIGWAFQYLAWRTEREERQAATKFIMEMLVTTVTEKTNGTNAITALTTAVNAVITLVKDARP